MGASTLEEGGPVRIGAIYPDDAWVDRETQALVEDFSAYLTDGADLIAASTPVPSLDATYENSVALAENGDDDNAQRQDAEPRPVHARCTCASWRTVERVGDLGLMDRAV